MARSDAASECGVAWLSGRGLLVLKGGNLLVVMISGGADMSEEEGIEASKEIGAIAAGRLQRRTLESNRNPTPLGRRR